MRQVPVDEEPGAGRLGVLPALDGVLQVGKLRVELVHQQLGSEDAGEHHVARALAGGHDVALQVLIRGQDQPVVVARGHALRTGERGHVGNELAVQMLRRVGHAIRQHQAALGVGVVDLNREAAVRRVDVVLQEAPGADGVLRHAEHAVQGLAARQASGPGGRQEGAQHARRAPHVALHAAHARARLEGCASGVERDALAHQRDALLAVRLPRVRQSDQARGAGSASAGGPQQVVAALRQLLALDHGVAHARDVLDCLQDKVLVGPRVDDVWRHVNQALGDPHSLCEQTQPGENLL
mmetsp:Transcript_87572/g.232479  ORF Transcript_87572/g.232479 Transcript_87572/m.232479 type:complete len:296 (+) Transcript_87572:218-1105(+)